MTITVEIGGVDRSNLVSRTARISWEKGVNGQGNASVTLADAPDGFVPDDGMAVLIKEDGVTRFDGRITGRPRRFKGPDHAKQLTFYSITVGSNELILNKRLVYKEYRDVAFEDILDDFNADANILQGEGITMNVTAGSVHSISFNGATVAAAVDELCEIEADGRTWRMETGKILTIEVLAATSTPETLHAGVRSNLLFNSPGVTNPTVEPDRSTYDNRVTVVGGGPGLAITFTAQDAGEIAARAAIETGTTGIYHHEQERPEASTSTQVEDAAEGILAKRKTLRQRFTGTTDVSGFAAGQTGIVDLPNLGLDEVTMFVESVRTSTNMAGLEFLHTVSMITGDPDGGYQSYYRNEKRRPKTIPMQIEATPGLVRVESQAGALVHDPPREPGEWFQGQASGALDEGVGVGGLEHIIDASIGHGAFAVTMRRGGAAGTSGCGGGTFPGYLIGGAYCHDARQTIIEKWKIGADQLIGTSPRTGFSWPELAASANFKEVLVIRPDNRYAAFIQFGAPGFFGVVSIAGEGFRGSCASNMANNATPGEPIWVGEYVYWPNSLDGKIFIYHVPGTATAPTEVGFFLTSLANVNSLAASADGNTLYACGPDGFVAMDIGTDPEAPGPQLDSGALNLAVDSVAGTFTRGGGSFVVDGFAVGQSILGSGFTNGGNNTYFIIDTVAALVITVLDSTGMVTEPGDGDEQLDAIEDGAVRATAAYLSFGLNPEETALCAFNRVDANNLRSVTINVSGTTLALNDEKTHAVATSAMAGEGVLFFDDSAICFSHRDPGGVANQLDAHVFDLTDLANVQYTEKLDYTHVANLNFGPFKSAFARKILFLFGAGTTTQITFGTEIFDEVGQYEIDEELRPEFGGTGIGEYVPGNIIAAIGRTDLSVIEPPAGDGWALVADESEETGWAPKDISAGAGGVSYVLRSLVNGTFQETFDALVTSDGATVTMSLEQSGGGDLSMQFSDGVRTLDCTPAKTIALTAGSDASPTENYIYILQSDAPAVLTKDTTDWPATEHIKVAFFLVPSAGFVQTNGPYINQNWNDHLQGTDGQGHLSHMAERSRRLGAVYHSGIAGNGTSDYVTIVGAGPSTVFFKSTAGVLFQMHRHVYGAMDTDPGGANDKILVVNDSVTAYDDINDLADLLLDAGGSSMAGKYFNLVMWGVANKSGEFVPMMCNLPNGSYNTQSGAEQDTNGHDVFTIPGAFARESTSGFLICRITLRHQAAAGGTWTHISTLDLRGVTPAAAAGGSTGIVTTEFPDNTFRIFDEADPTREIEFSADGITTGNTRTVAAEDGAMTIPLTSEWDDLTDGGETALHIHDARYYTETELDADQLTQYALLAGRAGDQVLIGSLDSGGSLTLVSSDHATKGPIYFGAAQNSAYDEVNDRLGVRMAAPVAVVDVKQQQDANVFDDGVQVARSVTTQRVAMTCTGGSAQFNSIATGDFIPLQFGKYETSGPILRTILRIDDASDAVLIGTTTRNTNMGRGLTINQSSNNNQILSLKSSDVATVLTTAPTANVETTDYYTVQKLTAAEGGALVEALCEDGGAAETSYAVHAYGATADTTKSTAGRALIEFYASEHDGANALTDVTAEGNVYGVRCRRGAADVSLMLIDEDAKMWLGGEIEIDGDLNHDGSNAGFYGTAPIAQPDVSGARDAPEEALADLIAELANLGLITDSTTAS